MPEAGSFPGKRKEGILGSKRLEAGRRRERRGRGGGQGAGTGGSGLQPSPPPGGARSDWGPESGRRGLGRGRAWTAFPPLPEECGLWLVPCPHSGQRWNVNRVFTAHPKRTSSVPSHQRAPGSGSWRGLVSATPTEPATCPSDSPEGCQAYRDSAPAPG